MDHRISTTVKDMEAVREFTVKDSGERKKFDSGMVRDTVAGKVDWWRVFIGPILERLAIHVTKGAVKYPDVKPGVPNWTLASGPEELQRFRESACRHFVQWLHGDMDEDHAAAVVFNINGAEYVKDKLLRLPNSTEKGDRPGVGEPIRVEMRGGAVEMPSPEEVLRRVRRMEQKS